MTADVPEMTDLYRHLLDGLTAKFGTTLDEANADAIAYAAAELYHRDFEPRLWEEKTAHEVLDLFGVPRAGMFSPYSLGERLVVFQRRSHRAEYVNRAHDVLTALGVARHDEDGAEYSLKTRLDLLLSRSPAEHGLESSPNGHDGAEGEEAVAEPVLVADEAGMAEQAEGGEMEADATEDARAAEQAEVEEEPAPDVATVAEVHDDEDAAPPAADEAAVAEGEIDAVEDEPAATVEEPVEVSDGEVATEVAAEIPEPDADAEAPEGGAGGPVLTDASDPGVIEEELPGDDLTGVSGEPVSTAELEAADATTEAAGIDVDDEPGAAPLVEAVRALEQAARVEAELAEVGPEGPGGVDVVRLSAALNGLQAEVAALRTMIESLGNELRERLEAIHEEVLTATGVLQPNSATVAAGGPAGPLPADQETRVLPPVAPDVAEEEAPPPRKRRVLLFVILFLLGLVIAGAIVLLVVYGWDRIESEVTGVLTASAAVPPALRPPAPSRGARS